MGGEGGREEEEKGKRAGFKKARSMKDLFPPSVLQDVSGLSYFHYNLTLVQQSPKVSILSLEFVSTYYLTSPIIVLKLL